MGIIKGQTVKLHVKEEAGLDDFGTMQYVDSSVEDVDNVYIETVGGEQLLADFQFYGKRTEYILHIPKDDTHVWEDTEVEFYGKRYKTYGAVTYIPFAPLDWNKKVRCEIFE